MPKESLQNLRELIESATDLSPDQREELRRVAKDLENEVHPIIESDDSDADTGHLREAIDVTGRLVKQKGSGEEEDLLGEFETAVDKVAISHPVIAGFLTALGKLV